MVTVKSGTAVPLDRIEGQTYVVGREGHIYIGDKSVSRKHAEIQIVGGKIHLRDLDSANGTYVIKDNRPVLIKEAILQLHHTVVIGKRAYTVKELLDIIRVFSTHSDESGALARLNY